MNLSVHRKRIAAVMWTTIVFAIVLAVTVNFTDASRLRIVTIDGERVDRWDGPLKNLDSGSVVAQPLDELAVSLLAERGIYRVDARVAGWNSISVLTNNFQPVCFQLDKSSGKLRALDRQARETPLPAGEIDWQRPIITGASFGKLYLRSRNPAVMLVVEQLANLEEDNVDLFRMVEEIRLGKGHAVMASLSGLSFQLKLRTEFLADDLARFIRFYTDFDSDLTGVRLVDLSTEGMAVCRR